MTLDEYQERAMTTCMPSSESFAYMMLNLVGEVGEFAGKVAKAIRKEKIMLFFNQIISDEGAMSYDDISELRKEAGDILWQLSGLCSVVGWSLEDVAMENLEKLASRKERNVIDGSGDNR